jgi:DNA polymerase I
MAQYLMDTNTSREGLILTFYNHTTDTWNEVLIKDFKPYFFIPHPITQTDQATIDEIHTHTRTEAKRDLFTGQPVKITRVEINSIVEPRRFTEKFEKSWESEVPSNLGYVYDHGLTFGAQHTIQGERIKAVSEISETTKGRFEERFSELRKVDPLKHELLERWFVLCSQPVPTVAPERLGIRGRVDPERYYLAFMLARVANLPVVRAYSSRQVSVWIRSILHNYLRRNHIRIPTSRELRRGETTRSVQGALTFPPEPGVYFDTVVVDFESLYPSLIDAYNLSYETINCPHAKCQERRVPGLAHHVCQRQRGVYSILIGAIKDLRIHWYKPLARDPDVSKETRRLAQATSQLLKLILVSSYGVTVRIHGLARPSLAESITAYGRYSLQTTWDLARESGLQPIYGDTDSLFLDDPRMDQVEWLIKTVKARLHLDLMVDERYSVCVLPRAMKAYFGIRKDGTPDIKGVTAIKSNSPKFIQNVFRECVKEFADVNNQFAYGKATGRIQNVVRNAIKDLKAGKVALDHLEYRVEVHEDPVQKVKDKVLHQPYQCAAQRIDSGKSVRRGDTVSFVKVKPFQYGGRTFTVKPTEQVRDFREVNMEDYIRNLRTALNQTFRAMDIEFQEEDKKVTLADFL